MTNYCISVGGPDDLPPEYNLPKGGENMTRKNLIKAWDNLPRFVRVGVWVAISAGLTALISYLLEQPEMVAYYGVLNIILVALKESRDVRKANKK